MFADEIQLAELMLGNLLFSYTRKFSSALGCAITEVE